MNALTWWQAFQSKYKHWSQWFLKQIQKKDSLSSKKPRKKSILSTKKNEYFLKKLVLVTRIWHYIGSTQNSSEQFTCQFEWCCLALKRFVLLFSHSIFLSICPTNATRSVIGIKFDSNLLLEVWTKKLIWLITFSLNTTKWMSSAEFSQSEYISFRM